MSATAALIMSMPSVSRRSAGMPRDAYHSHTLGSTSVANSGASSWMYVHPSAASSSTSERTMSTPSANNANGSA
jgi:hypothetical protein